MIRLLLFLSFIFSVLISCRLNNGQFTVNKLKVFQEDKSYQRLVFSSEEVCKKWQETNPHVNCYQWVKFSADGTAFVILTDMPNTGTYNIYENKINISFTIVSDSPKEMTFVLSADQTSVLNTSDNQTWLLYKD